MLPIPNYYYVSYYIIDTFYDDARRNSVRNVYWKSKNNYFSYRDFKYNFGSDSKIIYVQSLTEEQYNYERGLT